MKDLLYNTSDKNKLCHFTLRGDGNILFTTFDRLEQYPFWEAVVRIGTFGNFLFNENMQGGKGLPSPVF